MGGTEGRRTAPTLVSPIRASAASAKGSAIASRPTRRSSRWQRSAQRDSSRRVSESAPVSDLPAPRPSTSAIPRLLCYSCDTYTLAGVIAGQDYPRQLVKEVGLPGEIRTLGPSIRDPTNGTRTWLTIPTSELLSDIFTNYARQPGSPRRHSPMMPADERSWPGGRAWDSAACPNRATSRGMEGPLVSD